MSEKIVLTVTYTACFLLTFASNHFSCPKISISIIDDVFLGTKSFAITGTVPITYKGAKYAVLLTLWVPFDYPSVAPNVSVIPTDGLAVPSNHSFVTQQGHVDFKKLEFAWDSSYHSVFLIETLQQAFGREPPLRQVSAPPSYTSTHNSSAHVQTQQPPTYHSTAGQSSSRGQPSPSVSPSPTYHVTSSSSPNTNPAPSNPYEGNFSSSMPALQPTLPPTPQQLQQSQHQELLDITATQLVSVYEEMQSSETALSQISANTLNEWNDKHTFVKYKLEQAKEVHAQTEASIEHLSSEVERLKALVATRKAETMHGQIDYDALAEPSDPYLRTVIACHAKDLAMEDIQYYLEKALQNNVIDLKQFLKVTRDLSTEQFYQRVLIQKINIQVPFLEAQ